MNLALCDEKIDQIHGLNEFFHVSVGFFQSLMDVGAHESWETGTLRAPSLFLRRDLDIFS